MIHKAGICYLFGAGDMYDEKINICNDDYVIAADGGFHSCIRLNIKADLVVGDFDSLGEKPHHDHVITFESEKNDTDMMIAVKYGLKKGYSVFYIYGGTGGRFDHTMANIQTLVFLARHEAQGFLMGEQNIVTAITSTTMCFDRSMSGFVSVLAHDTKVTGVTLTGLKYHLENETLTNDFPLGVSNEFQGTNSSIKVGSGTVLIIYQNQR